MDRARLWRPKRVAQTSSRFMEGWRVIVPVWIPRYERFYDINQDVFRYGVRVDTIALSVTRDRHGLRIGLDWGPFEIGEWTPPATKPIPWLAA